MENQSYTNSSYSDSRNSTPRSREIDCENELRDEQPKKVKLMCSYGGKIQPLPHGNRLSYIGGDSKILIVDKSIKYEAFIAKLSSLCGSKSRVWFKYQLPGEDLDALISVTNDEDLEHMMLEYDRSPKPARLRLFLWFVEGLKSVEQSGFGKGGQTVAEVVSEMPVAEGQTSSQFEIHRQLNELQRMQNSCQEQIVYQHISDGTGFDVVPMQQGIPVYLQGQSQMIAGGNHMSAGGSGVEQAQQVYIIPAPGGVYQASTNYEQMTMHNGQAHTQAQACYVAPRIVPEAYQEQQVYASVPRLVMQNIQQPTISLYAEGMSRPQLTEGGYGIAYDGNGRQVYYNTATAAGGGVAPTYQVIMPTAAALPVGRFAAVNQEGNGTIPPNYN